MAALLLQGLIFYYLDDFFAVFKEGEQAQKFGEEFDSVFDDLSMGGK